MTRGGVEGFQDRSANARQRNSADNSTGGAAKRSRSDDTVDDQPRKKMATAAAGTSNHDARGAIEDEDEESRLRDMNSLQTSSAKIEKAIRQGGDKVDKIFDNLAKKYPRRNADGWKMIWRNFCYSEWDQKIQNAQDENKKHTLSRFLQLMQRLEGSGKLPETSETFLESRAWHDQIEAAQASDKGTWKRLKKQMYDRALDGTIPYPQDPLVYTCLDDWNTIQDAADGDQQEFWARARKAMLEHAANGAILHPEPPGKYFCTEEWDNVLHPWCAQCDNGEHKTFIRYNEGIERVQERVRLATIDTGAIPLAPFDYLLRDFWQSLIDASPIRAEKDRLRGLELDMYADVFLHDYVPYKREMAECRYRWKKLHSALLGRTENAAIKTLITTIFDNVRDELKTWHGDHLPQPITYDQTVPLDEFLQRAQDGFFQARERDIVLQWTDWINNAPDHRSRANLVRQMHAMLSAGGLTRPVIEPPVSEPLPPQPRPDLGPIAREIGFDNPDIAGRWHFRQAIGEGAYGFVAQWVALDAHGNVVSRVATKDTYGSWDIDESWEGDVSERIPMEFAVVQDLNKLQDSENVIRMLDYKSYEDRKMFRLYMEYCEHGTLEDLINVYLEMKQLELRDQEGQLLPTRIPARMVWSIFDGLTNALCLMQLANLPDIDSENRAEQWHFGCLFHRDLKPSNILLASEDSDKAIWPGIPTAKVGDFGLAVREYDCPTSHQGPIGTPGYRAPESLERPDDEALLRHGESRFGSYSDVWVVGRIMLSLMNLDRGRDIAEWEFTLDSPGDHPNFGAGVEEYYGDALCSIVEACLTKSTTQRLDVEDLYRKVKRQVATWKGRRGRPMREWGRQDGEVFWHTGRDYVRWARDI